jgi:hypothetical protein
VITPVHNTVPCCLSLLIQVYADQFTAMKGDRPNAPNYCLVLTDGQSNVLNSNTIPASNLVKSNGAYVIAIGIGSAVDTNELAAISSPPNALNVSWGIVPTFDALRAIVPNIVDRVCQGMYSSANQSIKRTINRSID